MTDKHEYMPHEHEHADAWHHHTLAEGMPQREHASHVDPLALFVALTLGAVFTVGAVVVTIIYFVQHTTDLKRDIRETTNMAAQQIEYHTGAMSQQDQYAWEDAEAGLVRIPVSQAMLQVARDYGREEARRDPVGQNGAGGNADGQSEGGRDDG